ncbi:hypothetical protein [Herpetosiphon llansteffanensis]|uniref:hypothetical protein n=1 Tax=Herpetosiphon llansteffanensis TaxID=2094568 RepID=UPI000F51AE03|nr:hypothetical protein [Herpetosiphon llansteffanensis]
MAIERQAVAKIAFEGSLDQLLNKIAYAWKTTHLRCKKSPESGRFYQTLVAPLRGWCKDYAYVKVFILIAACAIKLDWINPESKKSANESVLWLSHSKFSKN